MKGRGGLSRWPGSGREYEDGKEFGEPLGGIMSLCGLVKELCGLDERAWCAYAWSREPLAGRISDSRKWELFQRAAQCGRQEAAWAFGVLDEGGREPEGPSAPVRLARRLGLTVEADEAENGGGQVIFAQYEEPSQIRISMDCLRRGEALLETSGLKGLLGPASLLEVILAHEIFHALEYRKRSVIYTRTLRERIWKWPVFGRAPVWCLGEIAGMEFARALTGMPVSPYILDAVLLYAYSPQGAAALAEEIRALSRGV